MLLQMAQQLAPLHTITGSSMYSPSAARRASSRLNSRASRRASRNEFQQFRFRSLLRIHTWDFLYPADPPAASLLHDRGKYRVHVRCQYTRQRRANNTTAPKAPADFCCAAIIISRLRWTRSRDVGLGLVVANCGCDQPMHHKPLMMHEISKCNNGWRRCGNCSGRPTTRRILATFAPAHCFNRRKGFPR